MATRNKSKQVASDGKLVAGLEKNQASLPPSFKLIGKTVTPSDCVTVLNTRIGTANASDAARAQWQTTVKTDHDEIASTKDFVAALKAQLVIWYKNDPGVLADYGLTPPKSKAVKTVAAKVVAVAKSRATREARGTKGAKQKKAIKGAPPATVSIAVPAPVPVQVPASPAGSDGRVVSASIGAPPGPSNGSPPHA